MGTEQKITVGRIIEIYEGTRLVEALPIDFTTSYRLARLSDSCRSVIKSYQKIRDKIHEDLQKSLDDMGTNFEGKADEEKKVIQDKAAVMEKESNAQIDKLLEQEETVKVPELFLKNFEGKNIPPKFFVLLGDVIKE